MKKVLILVDIQNDFMPTGALPVREGDQVVPVANRLQDEFDFIVATQDWHPLDHLSFSYNHPGTREGQEIEVDGLRQILWPVHCVQHTPGAEFHPDLKTDRIEKVFHKGADPRYDSYSGFFDNGHRTATGLGVYLKEKGVTDVYLCGLATDYCVQFTALDGRELGFNVTIFEDACRGVDMHPGDVDKAVQNLKDAGVQFAQSSDILTAAPES